MQFHSRRFSWALWMLAVGGSLVLGGYPLFQSQMQNRTLAHHPGLEWLVISLGVSFLLSQWRSHAWIRGAGEWVARGVLVVAGVWLFRVLQDWDLKYYWPFWPFLNMGGPISADPLMLFNVMLLAVSLLRAEDPCHRGMAWHEWFSFPVLLLCLQTLVGVFYKKTSIYRSDIHDDLLYPVLGMGLLGLAIFFSRPEKGFTHSLFQKGIGATVIRNISLPSIVLLLALGWVTLTFFRTGIFSRALGVSILVVSAISLVAIFSIRTSFVVERYERRRREDEETLRKLYEEASQARVQAEEAVRAKDKMLAVVSHELRTPLTPVLMTASQLAQNRQLPEKMIHSLQLIERNVRIEARLIDELLDYTSLSHHKTRFEMENIDFHEVIEEAIATCRPHLRSKNLEVVYAKSAWCSEVLGDASRLQQVIWNLVKNAAKFSKEEGRIEIRTDTVEESLRIEIRDYGMGIEPRLLPCIFEPFKQGDSASGGLGLGLAITKSIVDAHGGKIEAFSDGFGQGASFVVQFPVINREGAARASQSSPANALV